MTAPDAPATKQVLQVQGRSRTLTVVGRTGRQPRPIVLLLHGSHQTAAKLRAFTARAFDRLAADGAAVLAYLDGYKQHWNDARISNRFAARTEGYDDVAFVRHAIDLLVGRHGGDPSRVYVVGFSNGGQMAIRLVHEIPELLAGATVISATQPAEENFAPTNPVHRPLPIMFIHGTKDPLVPYDGGMAGMWGFRPRGLGLSAPQSAHYYAQRNQISADPVTEQVGGADDVGAGRRRVTSVTALHYRQPGLLPVSLYTVDCGGHTIPGTKKAPLLMGRTDLTFDTVAAVAAFHTLPAEVPHLA
ncbi:alpha/beta hydrolase family esterase [Streptoverticillium reticulum]|uniref:alpha/beta hydrolase family esterase n=1 Tax=Streptoverticillium reticulum TaxID=1433415 RepID=UPI0039BF1523